MTAGGLRDKRRSNATPIAACLCFIALSVRAHYEYLRLISHFISDGGSVPRHKLLFVLFGALAAHIFEIGIFALGYWFADVGLHAGIFSGSHVLHAADSFGFSAEAYTSLGVGNLYLVGDLRLLAGMETLSGLLIIGTGRRRSSSWR